MQDVMAINFGQFATVYLLLLIVLWIMKKCKISQSKLLIIASIRMTLQLVLAGFVLTFIIKKPHPAFVILYLAGMMAMSVHTVLSKNRGINKRFGVIVALSLTGTGLLIILFFILGVVKVSFFNAQYTIPVSGMIMGNAMTGVSLGLKTFHENIKLQTIKIDTLINIGAAPKHILIPFTNKALETALLPTLNSMLGMGIISLPGMMTGQILSGTLPTTAVLYQITIMVAITAVSCLSVFCSLFFGYRTLYNSNNQILMQSF